MAIHLACTPAAIEEGRLATMAYLDRFGVAARVRNRVEVVLEELVSNIVRHSQDAAAVTVSAGYRDGLIRLVVEDDGAPFNPLGRPEPAPFASLADAELGGLGISLVRKLARRISYARVDRQGSPCNRVTVEIAAGAIAGGEAGI